MPTRSSSRTSAKAAARARSVSLRAGPVRAVVEGGLRQRSPVDASVRRHRQAVEDGDHRGHHGLREPARGEPAQFLGQFGRIGLPVLSGWFGGSRRSGRGGRDDVGHEPALSGGVVPGDDHRLGEAGVFGQCLLDLGRFDPDSPDVDVGVGAAHVGEPAVGVPAHPVAGPLHESAGRSERAGARSVRGPCGAPGAAAVRRARRRTVLR